MKKLVLEIDPRTFLKRTLSPPLAGAIALVVVSWLLRRTIPVSYPGVDLWTRALPLLFHLAVATLAYIGGYVMVPSGRHDLTLLLSKLRRR